jgi:hypothetical protein
MPIAPPPVVNVDLCEKAMEKIDRLVMHQYTQGNPDVYDVVTEDNLSQVERIYIHKMYCECGWTHVTSVTSDENGERPGLIMWKLTR